MTPCRGAPPDELRVSLRELVLDLRVEDRVTFDHRYLTESDLREHLSAADVVVLPYSSREQISSGVLVDALAAGKPVLGRLERSC